jgi:hypothetical protein
MKAPILSVLVLLLIPAALRADPPGVVAHFEKEGKLRRHPETGKVIGLILSSATTDEDLAGLCELRELRFLGLAAMSQVTDDGLRTIAALPQVTELGLVGGNFTDAGLLSLERMTGLKKLILLRCPNVTNEGVARLRKVLPNCEINHHP